MPTYVHILNKPHPLVAEHFIMCLLVLLVVLYTCIIICIAKQASVPCCRTFYFVSVSGSIYM